MESILILFKNLLNIREQGLEKELVKWMIDKSEQPDLNNISFDYLMENSETVKQVCIKIGLDLFLPDNYFEENDGLSGLVEGIKQYWKTQKNQNLFDLTRDIFKEIIDPDFIFEEDFDTYMLEFEHIMYGLLPLTIMTAMLIKKSGGKSSLDELEEFLEHENLSFYGNAINELFEALDELWPNSVHKPSYQTEGGNIISGDIALLKKIEEMKNKINLLNEQNLSLNDKVNNFDTVLSKKNEEIEELKREKSDVEKSKNELIDRVEAMKKEWLEEALEEKDKVIENIQEDMKIKEEEFNEEMKELRDHNEQLLKENEKLMSENETSKMDYSHVMTNQHSTQYRTVLNEKEELENERNKINEKYMNLVIKTTELEQKIINEEMKTKEKDQKIEDLEERLKFYTENQQVYSTMPMGNIDISNINQSEISNMIDNNNSKFSSNDNNLNTLIQNVDSIIEDIILKLSEEFKSEGKRSLLGLKDLILTTLKKVIGEYSEVNELNNQLKLENDELLDVSEENKTKIEGLEEDLMSKVIGENKRLDKLLTQLDKESNESAKLAKNLFSKIVKRDFENQRLWKMKKRLTNEKLLIEKELLDQMELLYSVLSSNLSE